MKSAYLRLFGLKHIYLSILRFSETSYHFLTCFIMNVNSYVTVKIIICMYTQVNSVVLSLAAVVIFK